jgi:pimeloyl-ACP methyl ester carboxylesterase
MERSASRVVLALLLAGCVHQQSTKVGSENHIAQSADGVPIAWSAVGEGEPAIVLVHGWSCDQGYWRQQVPYFARTNRVITLDLAGHGASGRGRRDWTIQSFAADVAAAVRASGARRVILVGHSLAGAVVVEAALQLPDTAVAVVGFVTFRVSWGGVGLTKLFQRLRTDFVAGTRDFVRPMFAKTTDSSLVRRVADAMASASPDIAVATLEGLHAWATERLPGAYASLRVPLGAIQTSGPGHDRLESARASLPRLDVTVVPDIGHFMMLEDPARFNVLLDSLIRRLVQ